MHDKLNDLEEQYPMNRVMLTFAGLWCIADSNGVFKYSFRQIQSLILNGVSYDRRQTLELLIEHGFVELVPVDNGTPEYARVVNFRKHQWINNATEKPKYKVQKPKEEIKAPEPSPGEQTAIPTLERPKISIVEQLTGDIFIEEICINNGFEKEEFRNFAETWAKNKAICNDDKYPVSKLRVFLLKDFKEAKEKKLNGSKIKQRGEKYVAP